MSKLTSLEFLKTKSFDDLMVMYRSCRKNNGSEANKILKIMQEHNLLIPSSGGLPGDHPIIVQMREILERSDIREALKMAAKAGLPALSAVDEVFRLEIGIYYGQFDTASWAGTVVADVMREMGYKEISKKPLPEGSTIKTGAVFS